MSDGEQDSQADAAPTRDEPDSTLDLSPDLRAQLETAARASRGPKGRASLNQGTILDAKYEIEHFLDAGGMAEVYLAREQALNRRRVVIKIPKNQANASRFLREQEISGMLAEGPSHASIVQVLTTGSHEGRTFLVTEFVDGVDASTLRHDRGRLSIPDACRIIVEAASALEHAHRKSIVHRDVTPRNIMVSRDGRVKLLDFGLAKIVGSSGDADAGSTVGHEQTTLVGTYDYIPPEQWSDSSHVDRRADVYAMGCTLYELLAGEPPFAGHSARRKKRLAHQTVFPRRVSELREDADERLDAIVARCLAKEPCQRFATMEELAAALEPFATGSRLIELVAKVAAARARPRVDSARPPNQTQVPKAVSVAWLAFAIISALCLGGLAWLARPAVDVPRPATAPPSPPTAATFVQVLKPVFPDAANSSAPLSRLALVSHPPRIEGVDGWSLETAKHRGALEALAFDRQGRRLASAAADGTVRVWDCSGGRLVFLKAFIGHNDTVRTVAWSPDGKSLASGSDDRTVRLWDVDSGQWKVVGHTSAVHAVAWSRDGQTIAIGGDNGDVRLRSLAAGTSRPLKGHQSIITSLAWSADGATLASGSNDRTIRLWNVSAGDERVIGPFEGIVSSVAWLPGDSSIISVVGQSVRTFAVKSGVQQAALELHTNPVSNSSWSSDAGKLACVTKFGEAWLWSPTADAQSLPFNTASSAVWSADGNLLAIGSNEGAIEFRRAAEPDRPVVSLAGHPGMRPDGWEPLAYSPDGGRIASAHQDGTIRIWDATTGEQQRVFEGSSRSTTSQIVWSADGTKLAVCDQMSGLGDMGFFRMWNVETEELLASRTASLASISPDGRLLASCRNQVAEVRDTESGELLQTLATGDKLRKVQWSSHGKYLMTLSWKLPMRLWDVTTGLQVPFREDADDAAGFGVWSPVDDSLAFVTFKGTVPVWDGERDEERTLIKSDRSIASLAWFADGATVLTHGNTGEFELWDVKSNQSIWRISIETHDLEVLFPHVSPDGHTAATHSLQGAVSFWDLKTGKRLRRFNRQPANYPTMAWTAGGRRLVLNQGGLIRGLDLPDLRPSGALVPLGNTDAMVLNADGHYRQTRTSPDDMIFVVQRGGVQRSLSSVEFEKEYGWRNDPSTVRFADRPLAP